MPKPIALISGISGQDGSYLAELLLKQGYNVHGLLMPGEANASASALSNLTAIRGKLTLHEVNLLDHEELTQIISRVRPRECYHLAAQSFVSYDPGAEFDTLQTNIQSTHNILAALRDHAPQARFFFAASSEIFGLAPHSPQSEVTPSNPRSIYGISKAAGYSLVRYYRTEHRLFACSGILYNHESERRGPSFVTRKVTMAAARIKLGLEKEIRLGNLEARRDWGYAPDTVRAMVLMLQQDKPDDYVIGTGILHSVRDLLSAAFGTLDLNWEDHVVIDPQLYRPSEAVEMAANPHKARERLGWQPEVPFEEVIRRMVLEDLRLLGG